MNTIVLLTGQGKYGPFGDLVGTVGALLAAGAAIYLGFRGRARWEPSDIDITRGPQRVGSLLTAVGIAITRSQLADAAHLRVLVWLAIGLAAACVIFFLIYLFLVTVQTYDKVLSPSADKTVTMKVIGGFKLTKEARALKQMKNLTTQELLKGAAYDLDKIWTRPSRAIAKLSFVACYLGLTVCGTISLTCAATITGLTA